MKLLAYLIINGFAVFLADYLLADVFVADALTAVIVAIVFGMLNTFLKPILTLLTLPLTILSLGLFLIIINIVIVFLTSQIVPGFQVVGWLAALLFTLIVSFTSWFLNAVGGKK